MYFFKIFYLGIVSLIKFIISLFRYFFIGIYNIITIIPKYFILGFATIFGKKKRIKSSIQKSLETDLTRRVGMISEVEKSP